MSQTQFDCPAVGTNFSGIVEERVKVDRKRFEQMLGENSSFGNDADSFFHRVMNSTNTQIMWPPKLKPGTKSKKDPHVRITGSPNSINAAKEIIFEQLDTRRNRVTLKMDVAFTDHSHIIGKGGRSIQRVMDETGCHIHFPDSNRTNTAEKSNQVSIAGSAEGVEQSRCRIREMLPITLLFDLPLNNGLHSPPTLDPQSPQLQAIQQSYSITISFRCDTSKCNDNSYFASSRIVTVAVRGARSHLIGLRQGLSVLIEYLTGFRASTINVPLTMTIDVAVQHHSFIAGRGNCNLKTIMESTGAVITMPDPNNNLPAAASSTSDSTTSLPLLAMGSRSMASSQTGPAVSSSLTNLSALSGQELPFSTNQGLDGGITNLSASNIINRKSAIVISGPNFDSVYGAWQQLLGYLPLILIFDLKEGQDIDPLFISRLMDQMRQISILIKPKQRQNIKSIIVRGPEKDSRLLFHVRRQLLKLDESTELDIKQQASTSRTSQSPGQELHMSAIRAILDPDLGKVRQPTPYWAGAGFSKSVSEPMMKEKLSIGPLFSSNVAEERRISVADDNNNNSTGTINKNIAGLDGNQKLTSCLRLAMFLGRIGLVQYLGLFTQRGIDLDLLFSLNEADLADLGIPYVHRRKLFISICEVRSSRSIWPSSFDAAPGAERKR